MVTEQIFCDLRGFLYSNKQLNILKYSKKWMDFNASEARLNRNSLILRFESLNFGDTMRIVDSYVSVFI